MFSMHGMRSYERILLAVNLTFHFVRKFNFELFCILADEL